MAQDVIYPGEDSVCTWEKGEIHCFGLKCPVDTTRSNWSVGSFKDCIPLLIFCLVYLSIGVSGVLKSPTIIVLLLISPFILVRICLTYWGAPMLGAYIFIIVIIFFLDWPFDHYVVSFVSFHSLYFKVYFIWYEYCYSSFFWSPCAWNIFFQPFTVSLHVSLSLRWVSCRQHI